MLFPNSKTYLLPHVKISSAVDTIDIEVENEFITSITSSKNRMEKYTDSPIPEINLQNYLLLPTFTDMHSHIDKTQTDIRSKNSSGTRGIR